LPHKQSKARGFTCQAKKQGARKKIQTLSALAHQGRLALVQAGELSAALKGFLGALYNDTPSLVALVALVDGLKAQKP
jgi:hypothetical protein